MKIKVLILIAIAAVVTLSFTFSKRSSTTAQAAHETNEPIGGLVSDDKF